MKTHDRRSVFVEIIPSLAIYTLIIPQRSRRTDRLTDGLGDMLPITTLTRGKISKDDVISSNLDMDEG